MPRNAICAKNHRWEVPDAHDPAAPPPVCPICSSPGEYVAEADVEAQAPTLDRPGDGPHLPVTLIKEEGRVVPPGEGEADVPEVEEVAEVPEDFSVRPLPELVPGFDILGELGKGGTGIVYRARHHRLRIQVALKVLRAGAAATEAELARFRDEARVVARLDHPNIVRLFDVDENNGLPYLVLELVEGGSLDKKLMGKPQPPRLAAELIRTLARAVSSAHELGVVHRDLKPQNILLSRPSPQEFWGTPKITDFGLAKHFFQQSEATEKAPTKSSTILGTPSYMAPEQALRTNEVTGKADTYALGAILYDCLTGRPPFLGTNAMETLYQVCFQEVVPPRRLQPNVPTDLETICLKCLRKEEDKRYDDPRDLADDLDRYLTGRPILARRVSRLERGIKWVRRNRAASALVALCFMAVLGGGAGLGGYWYQLRQKVSEQLQRAEGKKTSGDLIESKSLAEMASDGARSFPGLGDLEARAQSILNDVKSQIAKQKEDADKKLAEENSAKKFFDFKKQRDEALFHASLTLGEDKAGHSQLTQSAAKAALGLYGVTGAFDKPPQIDDYMKKNETLIQKDCYTLLLILAETQKEKPQEALRILDFANRLAKQSSIKDFKDTKAYHLRRASYLEKDETQGNEDTRKEKAAEERKVAAGITPSLDIDFFLVGDELYRQDKIDQAKENFDQALRIDPGFFWARYFLALCHLSEGRLDEAKVGLTACLEQHDDLVWVYLMRGHVSGQLGDYTAAEEDFTKANNLVEKEGLEAEYVFYTNRGIMRIGQGNAESFATGMADMENAIKLDPERYEAYATLAQAFLQKNSALIGAMAPRGAAAVAAFTGWDVLVLKVALATPGVPGRVDEARVKKELDGNLNDAHFCLNQAVYILEQTKDSGALSNLLRARSRVHQGQQSWNSALADLGEAIKRDLEDNPRPLPEDVAKQLARDYVARGQIFRFRLKEDAKALEEFAKAIAYNPRLPDPHLWQAELYAKGKKDQQVIEECDQYFKKQGQPLALVYRLRGSAHVNREKKDPAYPHGARAVEDYSQALALAPEDLATRFYRAEELRKQGNLPQAQADFDEYIEKEPDRGNATLLRAYEARGEILLIRGKYLDAIKDFDVLLTFAPEKESAWFGRGFALANLGKDRYREALADAEKAVSLKRDSSTLRLGVARICALAATRLEQLSDSVPYLVRATRHAEEAFRLAGKAGANGPEEATLFSNLARIHAQAAAQFQSALNQGGYGLDPNEVVRNQERALACIRSALAMLPRESQVDFWEVNVARDPLLRSVPGMGNLKPKAPVLRANR